MSTWVANLETFVGGEVDRIGGKAASLADLARLGYPIPKSVCVTTGAFDREMGSFRCTKAMSHEETIDWLDSRPRGDLWEEIKDAVDIFRGQPLAVRSSATVEDAAAFSFAGQFESFLYLKDWEELVRRIRRCWASVRKKSVVEYCRQAGIRPDRLKMAVLIQEMIPAEAAGVLFTVNPLTGNEHEAILELCQGTAEQLMSGRLTPRRHVISLSNRHLIKDTLMPESAIRDLLDQGRKIHLHRGTPQDIEWAYSAGKIYLLQARPVTKINFSPSIGRWTTADMRDGGVSSYPVTPLMGSLYAFAFDRALNDYLKALGLLGRRQRVEATRIFFGRLYWNLGAVKERAMRLPGFVEREFDSDLGVDTQYRADEIKTPTSLWSVFRALPLIFSIDREFRHQAKLARHCLRTLSNVEEYHRIDLWSVSDAQLNERYRQLISGDFVTTEALYFRTLFNVSVSKSDFRRILRKVDPEERQLSYAELVSGLAPMNHFEPGIALSKIARKIIADPAMTQRFLEGGAGACPEIASDVDCFNQSFYYHSRRELDLTVPRWEEDPDYVQQMLRAYVERAALTSQPCTRDGEAQERYQAARRKTTRLVCRFYRRAFFRKLDKLRTFIWLREQMRDCSVRMYYWVRKYCVEIARRAVKRGRIEFEEDVFYLRWDEVPLLLSSADDLKSTVTQRREERQLYRNFQPPDEIGIQSHRHVDSPTSTALGQQWRGIGASPGVAVGRCRVVSALDQAKNIQPGDILVCPFTDPAWTPFLAGVGGVITESGGLLSHAAVICREYGIPAALNIPGATRFLTDGMQVRLDGFEGRVQRVLSV